MITADMARMLVMEDLPGRIDTLIREAVQRGEWSIQLDLPSYVSEATAQFWRDRGFQVQSIAGGLITTSGLACMTISWHTGGTI